MTGWCPVHDRTYEADDGLCPRCGTALVTDEAPAEMPIVIEHMTDTDSSGSMLPPSRQDGPRRTSRVAGIVAAILIAFVAGLAFPEVRQPEQARPERAEARSNITVGVSRSNSGLDLKLESFTQAGRDIVARFTLQSQFAPGSVRSAGVELSGPSGVIGADVIEARPTVGGFILDRTGFAPPEVLVTSVRLTALYFEFRGQAELALDLTGVWPATAGNEPRARKVDQRLKLGAGLAAHITGLVGWQNRLEVALRFEDEAGFRRYGYQFNLIMPFGVLQGSPSGLGLDSESVFFPFADVSRKLRETSLQIVVEDFGIEGDWRWTLFPKS